MLQQRGKIMYSACWHMCTFACVSVFCWRSSRSVQCRQWRFRVLVDLHIAKRIFEWARSSGSSCMYHCSWICSQIFRQHGVL